MYQCNTPTYNYTLGKPYTRAVSKGYPKDKPRIRAITLTIVASRVYYEAG